jgi:hypothetical protein
MFSSIHLIDEELLLRPFRIGDSSGLYCAVKESLRELKPWMRGNGSYNELTAMGIHHHCRRAGEGTFML